MKNWVRSPNLVNSITFDCCVNLANSEMKRLKRAKKSETKSYETMTRPALKPQPEKLTGLAIFISRNIGPFHPIIKRRIIFPDKYADVCKPDIS